MGEDVCVISQLSTFATAEPEARSSSTTAAVRLVLICLIPCSDTFFTGDLKVRCKGLIDMKTGQVFSLCSIAEMNKSNSQRGRFGSS